MLTSARHLAASLCLLATCAAPALADHEGPPYYIQDSRPLFDAETAIKSCWDESVRLRSGTTADSVQGFNHTVECLEIAFKDAAHSMFDPRDAEELIHDFFQIRDPYMDSIGAIYSGHRGCKPSCGTLHTATPQWAYAKLLEQTLRTMARNQEDNPPMVRNPAYIEWQKRRTP